MAEGMEVDMEEGPGPSSSVVKSKKRFEVKKVFSVLSWFIIFINPFTVECCGTLGLG